MQMNVLWYDFDCTEASSARKILECESVSKPTSAAASLFVARTMPCEPKADAASGDAQAGNVGGAPSTERTLTSWLNALGNLEAQAEASRASRALHSQGSVPSAAPGSSATSAADLACSAALASPAASATTTGRAGSSGELGGSGELSDSEESSRYFPGELCSSDDDDDGLTRTRGTQTAPLGGPGSWLAMSQSTYDDRHLSGWRLRDRARSDDYEFCCCDCGAPSARECDVCEDWACIRHTQKVAYRAEGSDVKYKAIVCAECKSGSSYAQLRQELLLTHVFRFPRSDSNQDSGHEFHDEVIVDVQLNLADRG